MALYQVEITVRLETYAHTEDEAIGNAERAIRVDSALAGPTPGVSKFGGAVATIKPDPEMEAVQARWAERFS